MSKKKQVETKELSITNISEYTRTIARENVKLLRGAGKHLGTDVEETMIALFLTYYIEQLIGDSLEIPMTSKSLNKEEALDKAHLNFKKTKASIQSAVADAFGLVATKLTKRPIDYYCDIQIIPEPVNKMPC